MSKIVVYCDAAVEPVNPGGFGSAAWCIDTPPWQHEEEAHWLGKMWKVQETGRMMPMSNNIAEYVAVGRAILHVEDGIRSGRFDSISEVTFRTDSQLVVEQVNGKWNCNAKHLIPLRDSIREVAAVINKSGVGVFFEWVPREQNQRADALSKSLYDKHGISVTERR